MFKVEENLLLTRNQLTEDSYVLEDCGAFFPELNGFYVCVPKSNANAIKEYMKQQPNSGFVVKTYEDDMVNGLKLLLRMEQLGSYTEEFVKYYGSVGVILDTFSTLYADEKSASDSVNLSSGDLEKESSTPEAVSEEQPEDWIDDSMFQSMTTAFENHADDPSEPEPVVAEETTPQNTAKVDSVQTEELFLMLRGIACKLGVIDYDDSHTLSKADMKNAQLAVKTLSAMTTQEGVLGALALAESKEDLAAVTRFLELFYTYLRENGLSR